MAKYLDIDGLNYLANKLITKIDKKVNAVPGKGLSTNDFTTDLKDKLTNIDLSGYALKTDISSVYRVKGSCTWSQLIAKTDAKVGDVWNVTDKSSMNYVCITADTAGASSWDQLGGSVDLSGYVQKVSGKGLSTNDFTDTLKNKLEGIAAGANNYSHPTGDGNKHVPANGTTNGGKFLQATSTAGVYQWTEISIPVVSAITMSEIDQLFA